MKAIFRKTGEIVDIISFSGLTTRNPSLDYVSYIDSNGIEHNRENLNYYWDFIEYQNIRNEENNKRIDRICEFIWKNRKGDTDEIFQQEQDVKWLQSLKN